MKNQQIQYKNQYQILDIHAHFIQLITSASKLVHHFDMHRKAKIRYHSIRLMSHDMPVHSWRSLTKKSHFFIYNSILNRRSSVWKVGLEVSVLWARVLMSSLEHSCEMRTSSHRAPPLIMSFAFTSAIISSQSDL